MVSIERKKLAAATTGSTASAGVSEPVKVAASSSSAACGSATIAITVIGPANSPSTRSRARRPVPVSGISVFSCASWAICVPTSSGPNTSVSIVRPMPASTPVKRSASRRPKGDS